MKSNQVCFTWSGVFESEVLIWKSRTVDGLSSSSIVVGKISSLKETNECKSR